MSNTTSGYLMYMGQANNAPITINDLRFSDVSVTNTATPILLQLISSQTVKRLTLSGVHYALTGAVGAANSLISTAPSGGGFTAIGDLVMSDVSYTAANPMTNAFLINNGTGGLGNVSMSNIRLNNTSGCLLTAGGAQNTVANVGISGLGTSGTISNLNTCNAWLFGAPAATASGTAQSASLGSTNLFTLPANIGTGSTLSYRVTCTVWPSTVGAGTVSIGLGLVTPAMSLATSTNNATVTFPYNNIAAGTAINYTTTYASPGTYNYGCELVRTK